METLRCANCRKQLDRDTAFVVSRSVAVWCEQDANLVIAIAAGSKIDRPNETMMFSPSHSAEQVQSA